MTASMPLHVEELRTALRTGGLDIAYQPQWDLSEVWDGELRPARPVGVEALCRWHHETLGDVSPEDFIPLALKGGFLEALDIQVLERAVQQVVAWRRFERPLDLSVNAAPTHFSSSYADAAIRCADAAGLKPGALTVEITETFSPQFRDPMRGPLARLRDAGIAVSVDDFGAGDTTVGRLDELPISEVKLDRSLVQRTDRKAERMIGDVVHAARSRGWRIVAEGIETIEDLARAVRRGCHRGQGFLWGRPQSATVFETSLA